MSHDPLCRCARYVRDWRDWITLEDDDEHEPDEPPREEPNRAD